ncbi:hypothetical protein SO802_004949 [Lithocarpus litseifolius]|uniref:Reverse transcriptase zinc-binding domain-containing protein n=1 Tax=Lithocarpus litseifolius TaxID=425828 RepID=A0AAW2DLC4_9ROSI
MAAKEIVKLGSMWLIGNGEHVDLWKDRWIPTLDSFKLVSPRVHLESNKVACLVDTTTRSWDVDKNKNGRFSAKSAYKVAQKWLKERGTKADTRGTFDKSRMQSLWKMIWNLKCPNKIKQFMWHSCRNILPTKQRLKSRGISVEDCCDQCGSSESSGHVLWGCKLASEVWSELKLKLPSLLNQMQEFIEVVWEFKEKKPDLDWKTFAVTA